MHQYARGEAAILFKRAYFRNLKNKTHLMLQNLAVLQRF
jgi:hypothetical protein